MSRNTLESLSSRRKRRRATTGEQRRYQPEITPEQSWNLAGSIMGGLEYGALAFDKPGAAARGVVSGLTDIAQGETPEWGGELLNLMPFSGSLLKNTFLGTDPDKRIYGRDLLTNWGAPVNKPGLFVSPEDAALDIAGFVIDVGLDPLWALRGPGAAGALTAKGLKAAKAGKAVAKADDLAGMTKVVEKALKGKHTGRIMGVTPKAMADEIRAGERTLGAFKLPFLEPRWGFNWGLSPEAAGRLAESTVYSRYSPVSWWRSKMSKTVSGFSPGAPQAAIDASLAEMVNNAGMLNNMVPALAPRLKSLDDLFGKIGKHAKLAGDEKGFENATEMLRYIWEQKQSIRGKLLEREEIVKMFQGGDPEAVGTFARNAHETLGAMNAIKNTLAERFQKMGGILTFLDDTYAEHAPRRSTNRAAAEMMARRLLPTGTPFASPRENIFRHNPGKTMPVNQFSREPLITATSRAGSRSVAKTQAAILETKVGNIGRGSVVKALDRNNYGRVLGYDPRTGKVLVHFVNPQTGAEAIKSLPAGQVRLAKAADVTVPLAPPPRDVLSTKDLKAAIQAKLAQHADTPGFQALPDNAKIVDLQTELGFHEILRPHALREGVEDGSATMEWLHRGLKADPEKVAAARKANAIAKAAGDVEPFALVERVPRVANEVLAKDLPSRSRELVDYCRKLPESVLDTGLFDRHLMDDWMDYSESVAEGIGNLTAAHNLLRTTAKLDPEEGFIPVSEAWARVVSKKGKPLLNDEGLKTFAADYAKHLKATDPEGFTKLQAAIGRGEKIEDVVQVPEHIAGVLNQYLDLMTPRTQKWLGKLSAQSMAVGKLYLTSWPAFHTRNLTDGTWRNVARIGSDTYSFADLAGAYKDVFAYLLSGKEIPGGELLGQFKVTTRRSSRLANVMLEDVLGGAGEAVMPRGIGELFDPLRPSYWTDVATGKKTPWGRRIHPLNIAGVAGEPGVRQNIVAELHNKGYDIVEFINRSAPFLAAMRAKVAKTGGQAKYLVDQIQFDYSKGVKGSFENTVMRKIFPFWGFVSNNIPYQFGQLMNYPGGGHAQTLRAITSGVRGDKEMPSWLRERAPVRLGGPDEEAEFFRQFGLSIEDLSAFTFSKGLPDIRRTGERFLAQTRQLATFPYKYMSERDPFTGRATREMKELTGYPQVDTALYSSPASRAISTTRMLLDERKDWGVRLADLLTGVKIGTYNLPRQQLYDLKRLQGEMLRGMPGVGEGTYYYPKKDEQSPEALAELELMETINARIKRLQSQLPPIKTGGLKD